MKNKNNTTDLPALTEDNFKEILTLIRQEDAEELYGAPELHADEDDWISPVGLYKGNLHVSELTGGKKTNTVQYKLIVDGDLIVDGIIDWSNELGDSYIVVRGNVKAKNIILEGCCEVYVQGNVDVENCILCHEGDDGGRFTVDGTIKAKTVILTTYFYAVFKSQPQAVVICDGEGYYEFEADYQADYEEYDEDEEVDLPPACDQILLPKFLSDEGGVNEREVIKAIKSGKIFLKNKS